MRSIDNTQRRFRLKWFVRALRLQDEQKQMSNKTLRRQGALEFLRVHDPMKFDALADMPTDVVTKVAEQLGWRHEGSHKPKRSEESPHDAFVRKRGREPIEYYPPEYPDIVVLT